jgi:dsDNA-specific endonuclease/ATPase MutS2
MEKQAPAPAQPPAAQHAAPVDTWEVLSNLKVGDPVYVRGWDVKGKALAIDKKRKRVHVELGRMRMEVDADDIFLVRGDEH